MQKIWNIVKPNLKIQTELSRNLGISKVLAQLLINRGITESKTADEFLNPCLTHLLSPDYLPDISLAYRRIKKAIKNKEKIMIFGDYDVDGLTGTALLTSVFKKLGLEVSSYLPHRISEGYGLSKQAIKEAVTKKIDLLVTVDCGMGNHKEIEELKRLNIDAIITDHHLVGESLPSALAVINPKRRDSKYAYQDLCGVGVAYKLACKITGQLLSEDLDLVCLGTIADVVPLTGENRIIAKQGLNLSPFTNRIGLVSLIEQSRIKNGSINAATISYILAPRINASGRIDSAQISLELLLSDSKPAADELAKKLCSFNSKRQQIGDRIFKEARDIVAKEVNFKEHKVIVLARSGWHEGVLGIVASRIKDMFYRPTVVISIGERECKGSARSTNNFHILEALLECRDFLSKLGGHQRAAGLSIYKHNIRSFKQRLNEVAKNRLTWEDLFPPLDIDMQLSLGEFNEQLVGEIYSLEPFGEANPKPIFYTPNLRLKSQPELLNKGTLRFWVTDGEFTYKAIGFGMAHLRDKLEGASSFDLAYILELDNWHDSGAIQLKVQDIRFCQN
jgi:single-stranded-DNA-specific exonuclease